MKSVVKFFDTLPYYLKIILALPILDGICYGIYRICKGNLVAGILWIFLGSFIGWVIDLYTLIKDKKISFYA